MPASARKPPFGLAPVVPGFHRATRLAKLLFQAKQSIVVLADGDGVWRSRADPSGLWRNRTPLLDHVTRAGELLWMEDASLDSRFGDLFISNQSRVRFYAAAPIKLADKSVPGLIAVFDDKARAFDKPLADGLTDLAAYIANECDRASSTERLARSEERLQLALELADLEVTEVDFQDRRVHAAGVNVVLQDRTFESMTSGALANVDPRDRARLEIAWKRFITDGEPYQPEYRITRDGHTIWARTAARIFRDETGRIARYLSASHNITHRKQAELVLLEAKEAAEAANKAKSTFLATMSHEIRTPLNGVLGMAQAMAMDDLSAPQRERLDVIRRSGEALLVILNDVLDLSKIEAGKMELEAIEFDIEDLAGGVHSIFAPVAEAKDCRLILDLEPAAAGVYRGDPTRLRQILCNLISNALKFTDAGVVQLSIGRHAGNLIVRVTDGGIGMSADQIAGLFQKFEQADTSTTRRFGGTGLGLAICRELVHLMGGTIQVESTPGSGSTFTMMAPLPRVADARLVAAEPQADLPRAALDRTLRILAAEDNKTNQLVLQALLQHLGAEVLLVENGVDAVAAWEAEDWDLILMDVQMPRMDGPTATREIRQREIQSGRDRTPIIALTANAMSHQVEEYFSGGMDDFVAKPIEIKCLFEAIERAGAQNDVGRLKGTG